MRSGLASICVTVQAPSALPASAAAIAGSQVRQRSSTRCRKRQAAKAVPQIAPPLLVPNSVAGAAPG